MKPEDTNIEPVLEAILMNQNEGMDEMNKNLEAIIVQGEENNLEPILENMIIQNDESQKILTDINNSIKEKNVTPKIEIEVDGATIEVVEGPKGDKGDDGKKGDKGDKGENGKDGKDGISVDKGEVISDVLDIVLQEIPTVEEIVSQIPIPKDGINGKDANENEIIKTVLEIIPKPKNGKDGKGGSPDTGKQIVTKLKTLKKGERLSYDDLDNTPDFGFNQTSKTVSLQEIDNVDLSAVTVTNGKYVLGSGGGAVSSVNSLTGAVVLTTTNIADSTNKRYVTDANLTTLGNTSNTNTGDETTATIKTKLGITTLSGSNTGDQTSIVGITGTKAQFSTAVTDGDILYVGDVTSNATHTGDVTGATALTIANSVVGISKLSATGTPSASTFLRGDNVWSTPAGSGDVVGPASAVTDRVVTFNGTTGKLIKDSGLTLSGTNTGDNAVNSLYSGLVSNATHTGDVTGATALTIANDVVTNAKMANMATKTYKGRTTAGTGDPEDVSVATLKSDLSLDNVTNESKATMFTNPVFTGNPTAPTPTTTDNDTSVATTAFVQSNKIGYVMQTSSTNGFAATDSVPIFFWGSQTTGPTYLSGMPIAKAGTIKTVVIKLRVGGTLGSNENSTISIRLNNTTDTVLSSTLKWDSAMQTISYTGLNIAVAVGDDIVVKIDQPAWATNPTTNQLTTTIYIE
jgi:hypothetical protein